MNTTIITTSVGNLIVSEVGNNQVKITTADGIAVLGLKCGWWNLDAILKGVEDNKEQILNKINQWRNRFVA